MKIKLLLFFIFMNCYSTYSQLTVGWEVLNVDCSYFVNTGIGPTISNKTWQMTQMYMDSIRINDSIPQSFQFVFKSDSLQSAESLVLFVIRKVGENLSAPEFKYTINQSAKTISIYHGQTGVLQKTFKVACLTPGHLALQFQDIAKDGSGQVLDMEYRFLVDYAFEYSGQ